MSLTIHTVHDLIRELDALVRETELRWWFRGHSSASWDLLPTVRRGYTREQERYLANEFYVRARTRYHNCPANDDYSGWLALMQHYGLPTRLLDWSYSPLIAAFFATEAHQPHSHERTMSDACLWALAPGELNVRPGFEPYLYPLNAGQLEKLIRPALKGQDEADKVVAAMAVETDARMQIQQGAFTVHASDQALNNLDDNHIWLRKFLIPAEVVPAMAWELERMGFRLADLFPDLGSLAKELRGRHRPASVRKA